MVDKVGRRMLFAVGSIVMGCAGWGAGLHAEHASPSVCTVLLCVGGWGQLAGQRTCRSAPPPHSLSRPLASVLPAVAPSGRRALCWPHTFQSTAKFRRSVSGGDWAASDGGSLGRRMGGRRSVQPALAATSNPLHCIPLACCSAGLELDHRREWGKEEAGIGGVCRALTGAPLLCVPCRRFRHHATAVALAPTAPGSLCHPRAVWAACPAFPPCFTTLQTTLQASSWWPAFSRWRSASRGAPCLGSCL